MADPILKRNYEWPLASIFNSFFTQDKVGGITERVGPEQVFAALDAEGFARDEDLPTTPTQVGAEPALGNPGAVTRFLKTVGALRSWTLLVAADISDLGTTLALYLLKNNPEFTGLLSGPTAKFQGLSTEGPVSDSIGLVLRRPSGDRWWIVESATIDSWQLRARNDAGAIDIPVEILLPAAGEMRFGGSTERPGLFYGTLRVVKDLRFDLALKQGVNERITTGGEGRFNGLRVAGITSGALAKIADANGQFAAAVANTDYLPVANPEYTGALYGSGPHIWRTTGGIHSFALTVGAIDWAVKELADNGTEVAYPIVVKRGAGGVIYIGYTGGARPVRFGGTLTVDSQIGTGTRPLVVTAAGVQQAQDAATFRTTISVPSITDLSDYLPKANPEFAGALRQGATERITAGGEFRGANLRLTDLVASSGKIALINANGGYSASAIEQGTLTIDTLLSSWIAIDGMSLAFGVAGGSQGTGVYSSWKPSAYAPLADDTYSNTVPVRSGWLWNSQRSNHITMTDGAAANAYRGRVRLDRWNGTGFARITGTTAATDFFGLLGDGSPTIPANYLKPFQRAEIGASIAVASVTQPATFSIWIRGVPVFSRVIEVSAGQFTEITVEANLAIDDTGYAFLRGTFHKWVGANLNASEDVRIVWYSTTPFDPTLATSIEMKIAPGATSEQWNRGLCWITL